MTKIEILNKYKKQKHNTYRECDVINAMEKYIESYKKEQAEQLPQTGVMVQLPKPETIWNNAREMNFLCFKKWFTKIKGN